MSYIRTDKTTILQRLKDIEELKKRVEQLEKENKELRRILHIKYKPNA